VLKVFHAARQDIEIFLHLSGAVPTPIFDTQVAAMVCGFGEAVSYETLVAQLAKAQIDKSLRFTDWAARPLSEKQLRYALSDVTHLRTVYEKLAARLAKDDRASWVAEEMALLSLPTTYLIDPDEAWRRLKFRSSNPRFLVVLKDLAAWREREARERDVPRQRIVRDDAILEIAAQAPTDVESLGRLRGLSKGSAEGRYGQVLADLVKRALASPQETWPTAPERSDLPRRLGPVVDLLKVLLKLKSDEHGVAQKLIASAADIDAIAEDDDAPVAALSGWRKGIFGADAIALKHGHIGLALAENGRALRLITLKQPEAALAEAPAAQ
jgi:ribonuclease D